MKEVNIGLRSVELKAIVLWLESLPTADWNAFQGCIAVLNAQSIRPRIEHLLQVHAYESAAIELVKHVFPGWIYSICQCSISDDAYLCPDLALPALKKQFGEIEAGSVWDYGIDIDQRPPRSPALALLRAAVTAQYELEKQNEIQ